ncbi:lysozyme 2-like [Ischnura elegans]|uniref:lysozyme 2-like n=1 Tax=Ischnura elegans TaxID=197161 RepID=UPI001ED86B9C|nr:lysozyme 2-like [Ischnura elegans]
MEYRRRILSLVILQSALAGLCYGKVYERCELARELKERHKIPDKDLATWVCIARHESEFNSSAVGRLNGDGSEDHGIFQISDKYWCSPPGEGFACAVSCASLEDDDLADDVRCAKRIKRAHDRVSGGNGFSAWAVYRQHCSLPQDALEKKFTSDCFADSKGTTTSTTTTTIDSTSSASPTTSSLTTTASSSQEILASSRFTWPTYYYMTHSPTPQYWYLSTPINSIHQPYLLG